MRTDRYEEMYHELAFNNEMLHLFANTQYESLFLLPQGLLKIKRPLQDDQLAFIYEKME